jgi:putative hemin transport protein
MTDTAVDARQLGEIWSDFHAANPQVRIRDAAQRLGVSELQLVATGCGSTATRLLGDWAELLQDLQTLGPVLAITRNEHAVHEQTGVYRNVRVTGNTALVLNDDIDLRLFLNHWHHGFAVREGGLHGGRDSLQFFDVDGSAVHKIYLTEASDHFAYQSLLGLYRSDNQSQEQGVLRAARGMPDRFDADIDIEGLRLHWQALRDTHDFQALLTSFGVSRTQALRMIGSDLARAVPPTAFRTLLERCAEQGMDLMVFVANPGAVQIHTGPVRNLKATGPWFNVLDEGFNLHLREAAMVSAWVVRKPTRDGDVTSLEVYGADGQTIALVFGRRKPGQAEDAAWRNLLQSLCVEGAAT